MPFHFVKNALVKLVLVWLLLFGSSIFWSGQTGTHLWPGTLTGFIYNSLHVLQFKSCSTDLLEEVEGPGNDVILKLILCCSSVSLRFSFSAPGKTFFGVLTAVSRSSMMSSGFPNRAQYSYHLSNLGSNLDFLYFSLSTGKIPVVLKPLTTLDGFKPSCHTLDSKLTKLTLHSNLLKRPPP